ncbi:hypothetical protein JCM14076_01980 [Methylosoma difficile]
MTDIPRPLTHHYQDPLARVWLACAEQMGFRVQRTRETYASSDGRGTLWIADDSLFDPDDSLAQMIFHELCHALVEGERGENRQDWGLGYGIGNNPWREHACLRLQAYLASGLGLRSFFAPTTDFRILFWQHLPEDPFYADPNDGGGRERSCVAARIGAWRASLPRWQPLHHALVATAAIVAVTPKQLAEERRSNSTLLPSLWEAATTPPARHPAGHAAIADYLPSHSCADCAWFFSEGEQHYCQHKPALALPKNAPACQRWEAAVELDCLTCGACCREAYDAVEVGADEAVIQLHPDLIVIDGTRNKLRRSGLRCAALAGGNTIHETFTCDIYPDRPSTCRDFTLGSDNCLDARQRVGLSL